MHMDSGIGRNGIRVLAGFMFAIGALGVAVVWTSVQVDLIVGLGLGIIAVAVVVLTGLAFPDAAASPRHAKRTRRARKADKKAKASAAQPPSVAPGVDVVGAGPQGGFEFTDLGATAPSRPVAAPLPVEEPARTDPRAWPERPGIRHPTAPVGGGSLKRQELAVKYTERTPIVRNILAGPGGTSVYGEIPEVTAQMAVQGQGQRIPDGHTRGRCGACRTVIFAPTARPIRLRCPRCGRSTLLHA
jgi:hypothetical protein